MPIASLLISYGNLSALILLLIVRISFYIFSKRFFLKRKGFSDAKVLSISEDEEGFSVHFFLKIQKVLKLNI